MTDLELLERAAKAAGLTIDKSPYNGGGRGNTGFDILGNAVLDWHNGTTWNPLANDRDALWLAVKLGINPNIGAHTAVDGDPCAPARRAIVRAAARLDQVPLDPLP